MNLKFLLIALLALAPVQAQTPEGARRVRRQPERGLRARGGAKLPRRHAKDLDKEG